MGDGSWPPAAVPPWSIPQPAPRPKRRRSRGYLGCLVPGLVLVVVVGAAGFAIAKATGYDGSRRTHGEMAEALIEVCTKKKGLSDVPAYERGAPGDLAGLPVAGGNDEVDAHSLAAGVAGDRTAIDGYDDVRVMLCRTTTTDESTSCDYFARGGTLSVSWVTKTTTGLRIVEVHSGKELYRTTFETRGKGCPATMYFDEGNRPTNRGLDRETASQALALAARYHQGG